MPRGRTRRTPLARSRRRRAPTTGRTGATAGRGRPARPWRSTPRPGRRRTSRASRTASRPGRARGRRPGRRSSRSPRRPVRRRPAGARARGRRGSGRPGRRGSTTASSRAAPAARRSAGAAAGRTRWTDAARGACSSSERARPASGMPESTRSLTGASWRDPQELADPEPSAAVSAVARRAHPATNTVPHQQRLLLQDDRHRHREAEAGREPRQQPVSASRCAAASGRRGRRSSQRAPRRPSATVSQPWPGSTRYGAAGRAASRPAARRSRASGGRGVGQHEQQAPPA